MAARRRLIAVSVVSAALATTAGAAFAAGSGTPAKSPATAMSDGKIVATVANSGTKSTPAKDSAGIAAVARQLGVSVSRLDNALVATKEWLGAQTNPTTASFAAHLASLLGLPSGRVLSALEAHGFSVGPGDKGKPVGKQGGHNVDIAKVAADLEVSAARVQDALAKTKEWAVTSGAAWTPQAFAAHVASLLGRPANVVLQVLERDGVLSPA